jgi:site-specific DNA recombinase
LLSGDFEKGDYLAVKAACEKQIAVLEARLPEISDATRNIDQMLTKSISNLSKAVFSYKNRDMEKKRNIVSLLYPARLVFDVSKHRTPMENDIVHNILLINNALGTNKNWTSADLQHLSSMVVSAGIEPATQGFSVLCSTD